MHINLKATTFTIQQLEAAVKKRYRESIHPDDLKNAFDDAVKVEQTLGVAVDDLVKLYVDTDGHEKNLILTPEELAARKNKSDKEGILKSIISAVSKPNGASVQDLKTAIRTQATLRKLQINTDTYGSDLVATLCEQGLVSYKAAEWQFGKMKSPESWHIIKAPRARTAAFDKLTKEQQLELCRNFNEYPMVDQFARRPRYETAEE